jgi:serine/threonine protein kinase
MELVRAPSLARHVDEHGPLPPTQVAEIGLQLLDALAVAHDEGIVHRDVKPSNVLLAPHRVVLTDFGIATSESDTTLTSTGLLIGSPTYMSPERLRGEGIGPPADIWSLGATLYAALEGQPPFRATTTMGTITAVLVDSPAPLHIAGQLGEAVLGMLDKDVATRLTGDQAAELLRASLEPGDSPVAVPQASAVETEAGVQAPVMAPVVTWQNPIYLDEEDLPDVDRMAGSSAGIPSSSFSYVAAVPNSTAEDLGYGEPSPPRGYDDGTGDARSTSTWRRRAGLLAVLFVLVAAGLTALLLVWTRTIGTAQSPTGADTSGTSGRHHHHRGTAGSSKDTPTSTSSASQSTPTSAPTATATSTSPASSAPTTASSTAAAGRVPPGYQLVHDPLGFQVAVPDGWTRRTSGASRVDYVSPTNSAMYLRVDACQAAAGFPPHQVGVGPLPALAGG